MAYRKAQCLITFSDFQHHLTYSKPT